MSTQQSQYMPLTSLPGPLNVPIILVHDHTHAPVITILYVNGDNELNFESVYKSIKALLKHPACSHRLSENHWPCPPCSKAFSTTYWESACRLLDYFADFVAYDDAPMSSLWFYLLDLWQETHVWFPCDAAGVAAQTAARSFESDFQATLELMNTVMLGAEGNKLPRERLVHTPSGEKTGPAGIYNTGPWISGLKPWEQFLCRGSPGVAGFKQDEEKEPVRYVPMAAIGIIKTHTERARALAVRLNPDPEFLKSFDQSSLQFPQPGKALSYAYRSLQGVTTSYHLVNGTPPVIRYPGYGDPNQLSADPTFTLLDEFVGLCKGVKAYEPVSGHVQEPDAGDEDDKDNGAGILTNEIEYVKAFDMWAVSQGQNLNDGGDEDPMAEGWEDKFEAWCKDDAY
jgi:hypothetical protein